MLLGRIEELDGLDGKIRTSAQEHEETARLMAIPGVGPVTAMAIQAFAPPMATGRIPSSSSASPAAGSSSSTTGASPHSQTRDATTCSRSSTTATPAVAPSSATWSPSTTGTTSSVIPHSAPPSSTGSSTTLTASSMRRLFYDSTKSDPTPLISTPTPQHSALVDIRSSTVIGIAWNLRSAWWNR